ncbi:MAG: ABC transporter substrate-binding protein [Deltaproteobacteria bacterium]|nr:ABC transporter substrate-binding protein [Deltaproteobacteria bacterium]
MDWRRGGAMLMVVLAFAAVGLVARESGAAETKVVYHENWIIAGEHVGDFAALELGFFREEGLNVEINRGFGAVDTLKLVATGRIHFGRSVALSVILGRPTGIRARMVKMMMHKSPYGLAYIQGRGIRNPKDLEGKKIAIPAASSVLQLWPAFAQVAGVDRAKVQILNMDPGGLPASVAAGSVDASDSWLTSLPAFEDAAQKVGQKAAIFLWAEYGLKEIYGSAVVASDETIATQPDLVRRFVRAVSRGHAWAIEHPKAAIDHFMKRNPDRNRQLVERQWRYTVDLSFDGLSEKQGLGVMDVPKLRGLIDLVQKYLELKGKVTAEEIATNGFVQDLPAGVRFPKRVEF